MWSSFKAWNTPSRLIASIVMGVIMLTTISEGCRFILPVQAQTAQTPSSKPAQSTQTVTGTGPGGIGIVNGPATINNNPPPRPQEKSQSKPPVNVNGKCNNVDQRGGTAVFNCQTYNGSFQPTVTTRQVSLTQNTDGTYDLKVALNLDTSSPLINMAITVDGQNVAGMSVSPYGMINTVDGGDPKIGRFVHQMDNPAGQYIVDITLRDLSEKPKIGVGLNLPSPTYTPPS